MWDVETIDADGSELTRAAFSLRGIREQRRAAAGDYAGVNSNKLVA